MPATMMTETEIKEATLQYYAGRTDQELTDTISNISRELIRQGWTIELQIFRWAVDGLSFIADELEYRQAKAVIEKHHLHMDIEKSVQRNVEEARKNDDAELEAMVDRLDPKKYGALITACNDCSWPAPAAPITHGISDATMTNIVDLTDRRRLRDGVEVAAATMTDDFRQAEGCLRSDVLSLDTIVDNIDDACGRNDALRTYIWELRNLQVANNDSAFFENDDEIDCRQAAVRGAFARLIESEQAIT